MRKRRSENHAVYIISLGCAKNFVDTEVMTASLVTADILIAADPEDADIMLINTCAFIPPAREEAEETIQNAIAWKRRRRNRRKVIVSGCLIQWDSNDIYKKKYDRDIDLWVAIDDEKDLGARISSLFRSGAESIPAKTPEFIYDHLTPRLQLTLPHYAYIKIAEGCDNRCGYCSIPRIRGPFRSRTIESVVKEAENLLANGVKELILIAQDSSAFGNDRPDDDENIVSLLERLDSLEGDFWIRLMYVHPATFPGELVDFMKNARHLLPYVDIPLQHISDSMLDKMNRKAGTDYIKGLLSRLRNEVEGITIRTTFLLGYPGETHQDFEELRSFVEEQQFDRLGVFPYYPEPETKAFEAEGRVSEEEAQARCDKIMEIQSKISLKKNLELVGSEIDVIIDSFDNEKAIARSYRDAPEIDNLVVIEDDGRISQGDFVRVKITGASEYDLTAELVE